MGGHHLVRVNAVLARAPGLPSGDLSQTLTFIVSIKPDGRLDEQAYHESSGCWPAEGSMPGVEAVNGRIVWDRTWGLRVGASEEDPVWPLASTVLRPGEYVTLLGPDGAELVFRVVNVGDAAAP